MKGGVEDGEGMTGRGGMGRDGEGGGRVAPKLKPPPLPS